MTCRDFQYEEGKEYETDKAELCKSGYHACLNPLDCFGYYNPAESVYHEVEIEDNGQRNSDDSKVVGKKIKIGARLSVADICKLHFEFVNERTTNNEQGKDYSSLSAQDRSSLSAQDCSSLSGGKDCVITAFNSKAKADIGSIITLANRECQGGRYIITAFKAFRIDGKRYKANTWYKLNEDGKVVKCDD